VIKLRRLWPLAPLALVAALLLAGSARATFPAVNGKIAFWDFKSGQVYTVNPDGSGLRKLTHTRRGFQAQFPDFAPDGRHLVFSVGDNHHPTRIWIANADGSRQHQLAADARGFRDLFPRYTVHGRTIVFSRCLPNDGDCAIWTMRADGTHLHALTPYVTSGVDQHNDFGSAVSPNGERIAFTRFEANGIAAQVFVMNADGSHPRAITPPGLEGGAPNWSPDGHVVAFNSNQSRTGSRIFTVHPDGTGLRALTPDLYPHNETGASYAPHGSAIAFASDRRYGDGCCFDLFEMNANGTGQHRVDVGLSKAGIVDPVWGPAAR
jgi:Tol biopolymer transport system component